MSLLQPGQALKHYRLVEKIGRGGMGEVYKAEDAKLGRHVAIKFLPVESMRDENARRRLLQEARSAAVLNHPSIVTIHSIDDHEGLDFIVMEFVEGETLKSAIRRGGLALPQVLEIGAQVAQALAVAHSVNIIHRDIKSENILLTPSGQAKVLDFGLAKVVPPVIAEMSEDAPTKIDLTDAGIVLGTVPYMSPEQSRGERLDGRSDIFSLGSVLYEVATGKLPFTGPSILAIVHNIAVTHPPPPSSIRPEIPREFDMIIERALAKEREHRYQTGSELAAALNDLRNDSTEHLTTSAAIELRTLEGESESFVGREPEIKELDGLLRQAIDGHGRIVFITGESGIGKTAIVNEFIRRSRRQYPGLVFARGRCVEQYGTGEAYLPFLDAISGLLTSYGGERNAGLLRTHAPTWCLQLPAVFMSSGVWEDLQQEAVGAAKDRMLREMGDALGAMAVNPPMVLILEDLHWADPSSIDLLRHLCQRIGDRRLLIMGTFRPEVLELNEHPLKMYRLEMMAHKLCKEISLSSLEQEHVSSYLNSRFAPNAFPRELFSLIQRKTEGHPLFTMSLIQYLVDRGDIAKMNDRWLLARPLSEMDLDVPENVRSMIRKKIESLDDEDRRALQYASVEGEEFLSTVVAHLLGIDDLDLEERLVLIDKVHRLIVTRGEEELPDGSLATRYRFAHALYQNVLYGDLVTKRRILLHRQIGERLVAHYGKLSFRIASQLAVHFERGRDFSRAVEFLIHAGDNASRLYAGAEAAEHYSHALRLVEKLQEDQRPARLLTIYQKRGAVNTSLGRFQQAVDDFTEMLEQARAIGSPVQESAALNALTMTL
ncbi:MAG TPA: protein kinase, partial [Blastocatellia bacterium]|nr:protein kinase [Blastocatellia bacterium]